MYNNDVNAPFKKKRTEANPNELNQDDARYGFRCCHLKNIWTAPLPPETELSRQMTTSTTSIDIMGLQAAYANLHTDQERDYFMQRYHDVISSFGGKTSYDADNRPLLFIFQAEDGIRYLTVTGVQTCALPIYRTSRSSVRERCCAARCRTAGWDPLESRRTPC